MPTTTALCSTPAGDLPTNQLSVASQDCDHVIQKLQSGYKSCVPSLLHACLASPIDRCHGGECNTPICLQLAAHRVSSCGTHRVVTHSRKMRFSAHGTSCAASPVLCNSKEACSEEQGTIVSRRWSVCRNGYVFWTVTKTHVQRNAFCSGQFQHELSSQQQVTTNSTTSTRILCAEASFNAAERGLRRGSRAEPLSNITFILASF